MTELPALRDAMRTAAHAHYGAPARVRARKLVFASSIGAALAAGIAALALLATSPSTSHPPAAGVGQAGFGPVPAATLAMSQALVDSPAVVQGDPQSETLVAHNDLPRVAAEYMRQTPYPPGHPDTFNWAATETDTVLDDRWTIQMLVERRSGCLWMRFWASARAAGDRDSQQAATKVLADVPLWPTNRPLPEAQKGWRAIAQAARAGDRSFVVDRLEHDCNG